MQKKILLSHPTGNSNVRGILIGLQEHEMLHSFHTSIACFEGSLLDKLAAISFLKEFRKRRFSGNVCKQTITYPYMELGRVFAQKLKINRWLTHEQGRFCIDQIYRQFDKRVAKYLTQHQNISAVYCYEDGALETFRQAKKMGIKCIYDLPIAYWRAMHRMLSEEKYKNPDWAVTLGGFNDSDEKLQRKDEELALANVIYVASNFTKQTLQEYPDILAPVQVIPYGFPPVNEARNYTSAQNRKLKLLYVGGLSQRKGISYLFEAVKGLEKWTELTIVGKGNMECEALKKALSDCTYIPSLPHSEILALMATQDILLFPSLFEGFGLVITEAMSQGTPVITTDRTCGPDMITSGHDSWLVEAGSASSIREQIEQILERPAMLKLTGQAAIQTAKQRLWSQYGLEMTESIERFLNNSHNAL
ncbi:hypothetical protein FACS1894182_05600 [Bacteroidia bacterium]|nr:hypothetical protein FACS1894182_05600 [Bacteroidia bacterium]